MTQFLDQCNFARCLFHLLQPLNKYQNKSFRISFVPKCKTKDLLHNTVFSVSLLSLMRARKIFVSLVKYLKIFFLLFYLLLKVFWFYIFYNVYNIMAHSASIYIFLNK